jgi:hypothetical protein
MAFSLKDPAIFSAFIDFMQKQWALNRRYGFQKGKHSITSLLDLKPSAASLSLISPRLLDIKKPPDQNRVV